jgi:hypothetical protein
MYEMTAPDPLETTVPDPVRRRMPDGRRRAIEVCALVCLAPALIVVNWIDGSRLGRSFDPPERVTVVPRGGTAAIGHSQWRLLGRDAKAKPTFSTTPPGSVRLTLLLQVRVLDRQGVKDATNVSYQVRDREGHVWSALGAFPNSEDPPAGSTVPATVTANVPPSLISNVVLEVRAEAPLGARKKGPVRVLRFAH